MNVIYKAIKTQTEDGKICYGIGMLKCYRDVFVSEADAELFANLCNMCKLSDTHFDEAIDDYLNK